jgi:hypothetical protein
MDQTLAQILSELFQAIAERDRLRVQVAQLQKVIDSQLHVYDESEVTPSPSEHTA